ncbi:class C sortase [Microbacterium sp. Sa1CUA4]|uniref:Class C sortase n=2 Tax=Microbacterium gallinarum TaxID=2762209 RepID=A0ABR8X3H5_9MICO|nr:class C sortase [Microbacterium gallinarum]
MPWASLGIALGFVLGVAVLLYPSAAGWFTQYQQSLRIDHYSSTVRELAPAARHEAITDAVAFNSALVGGSSVVAAGERKPLAEGEVDAHYDSLLRADDTGLMARIKIPAIDADLPIYHGTSDEVLARGIGHLEGTALPVGGDSTHSVLTGHRGLADAELFTNLDRVAVGDTFTVEVFGEVLTYQVIETKVVKPDETETLYPHRGQDLVTLVTCTPLGINSHRILVTAERILPTPPRDLDAAGERPEVPGFPWWALGLGGGIVVAAAYVVFSSRRLAPR